FYIYNSRGQLIRHFYVGTQEPGYYRLSWDGKDSKGISCANGVYQIVMKAGKNVYTRKAALMK
ncbi:MAG TPA: FlgD immunoglobulin-like domain containing protein, partial [Candidatus Syntrophosphaera thermopropionivorans]|nr:FlgD immunoglobulin-like domain containing protein [Candidatus Syntrophosphaera thermopropionivorans]